LPLSSSPNRSIKIDSRKKKGEGKSKEEQGLLPRNTYPIHQYPPVARSPVPRVEGLKNSIKIFGLGAFNFSFVGILCICGTMHVRAVIGHSTVLAARAWQLLVAFDFHPMAPRTGEPHPISSTDLSDFGAGGWCNDAADNRVAIDEIVRDRRLKYSIGPGV